MNMLADIDPAVLNNLSDEDMCRLAAALIERETLDESDLALLLPQPGMAVQ